jgi:hypothetical protein
MSKNGLPHPALRATFPATGEGLVACHSGPDEMNEPDSSLAVKAVCACRHGCHVPFLAGGQ